MKSRLVLLAVTAIGLAPGILLCLSALLFRFAKQPDDVIGGSRLPTFVFFRGIDLPFRTTPLPLLCLVVGMGLYAGALVWMTRALR